MHNIIWIQDNGSIRECAMCENYTDEPNAIIDVCLGCRHEYLAHTDDDANEMDYPKPDLFKMKGGASYESVAEYDINCPYISYSDCLNEHEKNEYGTASYNDGCVRCKVAWLDRKYDTYPSDDGIWEVTE